MSTTTDSSSPVGRVRQRTVLVIDNEAPIRDNLVRFLRLEGYQVIDAADGAAGLAAALQYTPDLILCDVMMPRLTGFEVLAHLQASPDHRHVPLIFLSASAEPEKLEEGLRMGARSYVTKPFNLAVLKELIAGWPSRQLCQTCKEAQRHECTHRHSRRRNRHTTQPLAHAHAGRFQRVGRRKRPRGIGTGA